MSTWWAFLSLILVGLPASALHSASAAHGGLRGKGKASAHVFVINLDERTDKCHCMASQLVNAPYPVTRFAAVSGDKLFDHCPNFFNPRLGGHSCNNTMALTCTNLLIWEQALKQDAEFVIILEDDVILSNDMWAKVDEVINGGCTDWDYIMVDAWHGDMHERLHNWGCSPSADLSMYRLTQGFGGSHFQMWRRDALQCAADTLRGKGYANPMDKVVDGFVHHSKSCSSMRAAVGFFDVAFQVARRKVNTKHLPARCRAESILEGDRPVATADLQREAVSGAFACDH